MPEFAPVFQLSSLNGSDGFRLDGVAAGDRSGLSVASAGDINGDGFADVIVGAPFASPFVPFYDGRGAVYVVFGNAGGFSSNVNLSSLNGTNGFRLTGVAAQDGAGLSVASGGDVNGDGFADLIIGAPSADQNGSGSGASYVVFGKANGIPASFDLLSLDGTNGFRLDGVAAYDYSGRSVACAGDINGDGFADLIVGTQFADPNGNYSGASYVVFGRASGFASALDLSSLNGTNGFRLDGAAAYDASGEPVATAGDVNGDGFADLIIGASSASPNSNYSGASYVVFGKASGFASNLQLSSLNGANGFRLDGVAAYDASGSSVASAGDVNGDGLADVIIGASFASPNGNNSGASYVVFGQASGFASALNLSSLNGTNGFRLDGAAADEASGQSVASAGDVNGDGFADLIIGASGADPNGTSSGSSYVVFGRASGFASAVNLSSLNGTNGFRLDGVAADDQSGRSVASAGDVNGDGFDDLIVGAEGGDPHGTGSGSSYVIYGHRAFVAVNRMGTNIAQTINGGFGDDTITALDGNDRLIGWEGNDTLDGGRGDDELSGGEGHDQMRGGVGNDVLDGGAGNDFLQGYAGADLMRGGAGDDTYVVDNSGDVVDEAFAGSSGIDTVVAAISFSLANSPVVLGAVEKLVLSGTANLNGGGNDLDNAVKGNGGANVLTGGRGDDTLSGDIGGDTLNGGGGNDLLTGGVGRDVMSGGGGFDYFDFNAIVESDVTAASRDVIADFNAGTGTSSIDRIDVSTIDANALLAGDQAFLFGGAFTAGHIRAVQAGGNVILQFNTDADAQAEMTIRLTNVLLGNLNDGDFIL